MSAATDLTGCHYLHRLVALHPERVTPAVAALRRQGIGAVRLSPDLLRRLLYGDGRPEGDDLTAEMLEVIGLLEVSDPPDASRRLVAAGIDASPVHAVGFEMHAYTMPGTPPKVYQGKRLPEVEPIEPGDRVIAMVDSGVFGRKGLPRWIASGLYYESPRDLEARTENNWASHGVFVAGLLRQIAPGHRVSLARARRQTEFDLGTAPGSSPKPTSELQVAEAILRLRRRHGHEPHLVDALNLSLGAYTCDPRRDKLVMTMELALAAWRDAFPKCQVVAAGGNRPGATPVWPAAFRRVWGVAAGAPPGRQVVWNAGSEQVSSPNRGWIRHVALGSRLVGATGNPDYPWAVWNGSSFATAVVTACHVTGRSYQTADGLRWWPDTKLMVPGLIRAPVV